MIKLIQLAYSGGKASEALLWMILRGEIIPPAPLIVTCANPGMEHPTTHVHTSLMEERCKKAGIPFLRSNRSLYDEILAAKKLGKTRFDSPGFYTKNRETGKVGKMVQKCTKEYKIAPMDRLARGWMDANMGISKKTKRLGEKVLQKWIGFSYDEWHRIKDHPCPKYVCFDYPLVNAKITTADILAYFKANGLSIPPRSVCNGCFANDADHFKDLHDNWPTAWHQAVAVDDEVRDWSQFGIRDDVFVFSGCIPLLELAALGFKHTSKVENRCHTGHCFI